MALPGKLFSIILVCYGDYPEISGRAMDSVASTPGLAEACDWFVGCNTVCPKTLEIARRYRDQGLITVLAESGVNYHKDPLDRMFLEITKTPYVLIMDDDSLLNEGWLPRLNEFIQREHPVDVAGLMMKFRRNPYYQQRVVQRPWWRGDSFIPAEQREWISLCVGGLYLLRRDFAYQYDYPDRAMIIEFEDIMLADLVHQVGGKIKPFPRDLLNCLAINTAKRRWKSTDDPLPAPATPKTAVSQAESAPPSPHAATPTQQLLDEALAELKGKRAENAIARYAEILRREPENPVALHLMGMLASSLKGMRVVAQGRENIGDFDYHLPLMSFPKLMKHTPQTLPANIPYLFPLPELVENWKSEFPKPTFHIGVAWQGNPKYKGDSTRSIPLRHFEALSKVPGVRLHSLQKVNGLEQFTALDAGRWMNNLTPRLDDQTGPYLDTAAVISHLDLVITTDTSIAHLAGALGKEVWVGLCSLADWRWLHRKSDTPWYPKNMMLFRQTKPGEWETVFEQIMAELKTRVNA